MSTYYDTNLVKNKRSEAKLHPSLHCRIACEAIVYKWKAKMFHKRLAVLIFSWREFQRNKNYFEKLHLTALVEDKALHSIASKAHPVEIVLTKGKAWILRSKITVGHILEGGLSHSVDKSSLKMVELFKPFAVYFI